MQFDDLTLDNMVWTNEFGTAQVAQALIRGVTGNPILHEQAQPLGQPMRLTGAWVSRQTALALRAKEASAGVSWQVGLDDGRAYAVAFDRREGPAVALTPVGERTEYAATHPYELTLNLIILEESA